MGSEKKEIMPHPSWENRILYEKPKGSEKLTPKTLTEITNAWDAHAYLDEKGQLWIAAKVLHTILRTNKSSAEYILSGIVKANKLNLGDDIYIRAFVIVGQLTKEIENAGLKSRGAYLRFSEECLRAIRDSDRAKVLRGEYEEYLKEQKKGLKHRRIRKFDIKHDELTGERLVRKTAEFSHIRSCNRYKELSTYIENGLIVNKETHDIITASGINNEEQLKFLCSEKNWDVAWHKEYQEFLKRNK
ncbi:hypothetical protein CN520_02725 [Bacillus cereus]|uniref:hypothetical protein n=1 Tax=Bacillus cereus TaxID=1396 RepID=UPI000BF4A29C|nr:hypothetical protein [Bacillus cereus]PET42557.1 hypothetical protein CN520_02725 [Bacillus cereus]